MGTAQQVMTDDFGHWLAGFIDGEGCFAIHEDRNGAARCAFYLKVRDDDAAIIEEIAARTKIGNVYAVRRRPGRQAQVCWQVQGKADCLSLVQLLDLYPLRGKKGRDAKFWSEAVREWQAIMPSTTRGKGNGRGTGTRPSNAPVFARMRGLRASMISTRAYPLTTAQLGEQ